MSKDPLLDAAQQTIEESMNIKWYWKLCEVEVEKPDHACSPDCLCWKKEANK